MNIINLETMHISNVFKFTESLGQDGHQIGRKVGDALELLTFAMIEKDPILSKYLVIENGIEGATTAEHKVEFSFYQEDENGNPSKNPDKLFGLIECKKVGVEQTINSTYKKWKEKNPDFSATTGYDFSINPSDFDSKWNIKILPTNNIPNNIQCQIEEKDAEGKTISTVDEYFHLVNNARLLIVLDTEGKLYLKGPSNNMREIDSNILLCKIIKVKKLDGNKIKVITIEDALTGPQTPEKAKQSSFVSLDVRKRVLGHFGINSNDSSKFLSMLVIGESSHWEEKSRNMVRLCNDYNLLVPDEAIVLLLIKFKNFFTNVNYQDMITKTLFQTNNDVKRLTNEVIDELHLKILKDMNTGKWVKFSCNQSDPNNVKIEIKDL